MRDFAFGRVANGQRIKRQQTAVVAFDDLANGGVTDFSSTTAQPSTIADRRALDASGDLAGAIRALRRLEPRTWSERLVTRDDRVACVRRWRPISDLFAYALSGDYAAALSRSV